MFRSYLRLLLFTFGLLVGVQIPGLINDYTQRVEAHLLESREGLMGFNQTAQRFFNGDLQALVRHYRASDDPVFNSDADSIGNGSISTGLDKRYHATSGNIGLIHADYLAMRSALITPGQRIDPNPVADDPRPYEVAGLKPARRLAVALPVTGPTRSRANRSRCQGMGARLK